MSRRAAAGRPEATSHADIESAAFVLFAERGFEGTTLDHIASAVGVTRRTLFRYYASKNDIPWGQFDRTLEDFRGLLEAQPAELPLAHAIGRGVVAFNDFPPDAVPSHAVRMRLILETPALQAHSSLKYAEWRGVVATYAAARLGQDPDDLRPVLLGHAALGIALSSYESWLRSGEDDAASLLTTLRQAVAAMAEVFGRDAEPPAPTRGVRGDRRR
ncbi:MAG: mycofactocin system transcriptional regulator [Nocardioides sp.]|uniref:mycofactocin system transcriptional regulator n=1 Tax=Nocardioides sp. TaxID=35761 RepID=UPI00238C235E|nr:mycofactocin system transcriptional regulator [Nocardioides sp.]MDE0775438.1 mycofactocin system transcriptional regulator [Nocardioides sp.]